MSCDDCKELSDRLMTSRTRFIDYRRWVTESLEPMMSAIAALDTAEGRMNFVMCGAQSMDIIVRLYRGLPEELRVGK